MISLLLFLVGAALPSSANVDLLPNGEIRFVANGTNAVKAEWTWTPTRWGMYELVLDVSAKPGPGASVLLGTNRFRVPTTAEGRWIAGRIYIAKTEPQTLNAEGVSGTWSLLPASEGKPIVQEGRSPILLHSRDAIVHGTNLRYEPATNKICVGYWTNPKDFPSWEFQVKTPGKYKVVLQQGCGKGQGGSEAEVVVAQQKLPFTVFETGHFQNFTNLAVGEIDLKNRGVHTLAVKPTKKKAGAIMDIRSITLEPVQ